MSESTLFKDNMNPDLALSFGMQIKEAFSAFDVSAFVGEIAPQLPSLELKGRVAVFAEALHHHLPSDFARATGILISIFRSENAPENGLFEDNNAWAYWSVAYYVEKYGLDDFDVSMKAMHEITKHSSCEFAIRPFLVRYPARTLSVLGGWISDPSPHVRRLVSEGTRTRLPWGMRLNQFVADPTPTLALLDELKDDESEYVRRSVANHLNDITKDNPDKVISILKRWNRGKPTSGTQWITSHALRSLVKAGDPDALALLGYGQAQVSLSALSITPDTITMGDTFELAFTLQSDSADKQNLVVDYVVHFIKANGKTTAKVFKLRTAVLLPGQALTIRKNHTIRPITTRRYYAGIHCVEVQVNGSIVGKSQFQLKVDD